MHTTRRSFLGALAAAALLRPRPARANTTVAKHLVVVFAGGGWDPTYVFDPKPDSPHVDTGVGDFGAFGEHALWLDASRPSVTDYFDRYGALTSVINGMNVPSVAHASCTHRVLTGFREATRPDVAAILGRAIGQDVPIPYLDIGGNAHPGGFGADMGYMGADNQLRNLALPELALAPRERGSWARHFLDDAQTERVRAFVAARAEAQREGRGADGLNARRIDDFLLGQARSHELPDFAAFFRGTDAGRTLVDQVGRAVDALSAGLCRTTIVDAGVDFDTHADNVDQIVGFDTVFDGLNALMALLEATPSPDGGLLMDDTVVLVLSEMGRTPRLNDDAGKDHWPFTSCMVAGAGVRGQEVFGGTDDTQSALPVDLSSGRVGDGGRILQSENVLAGVLEMFGVDPSPHFPGVEVFRAFCA